MSSLLNFIIAKELKDSSIPGVPINPLLITLYLMGTDASLFMMRSYNKTIYEIVAEIKYDKIKNKFIEVKKVNLMKNKKSRRCKYDLIHFYSNCVGHSLCGYTDFYTELPVDIKHKFYNILGELFYE